MIMVMLRFKSHPAIGIGDLSDSIYIERLDTIGNVLEVAGGELGD